MLDFSSQPLAPLPRTLSRKAHSYGKWPPQNTKTAEILACY
jgi:hypothetical protein